MKEHPILFSGDMVRALLDGRKTQTRRVVKIPIGKCSYGVSGDHLWVRETWDAVEWEGEDEPKIYYRADPAPDSYEWSRAAGDKWRPSTHMPRWASRITLEITDIRVERVQDISEADAQAEGVKRLILSPTEIGGVPVHPMTSYYRDAFRLAWDSIYAKHGHGFDVNPRVRVIEFKKVV